MRADVDEPHPDLVAGDRLSRPELPVEAVETAVQAVRALVAGEPVADPVQRELAARDAVGESPDDSPEVRIRPDVAAQVAETEDHVSQLTPAVRRLEALDDAAVGQDPYPQASPVGHGEPLDLAPLGPAPWFDAHSPLIDHGGCRANALHGDPVAAG